MVFSEFQVLLSHLWGLKKIKIKIKEDRRKKRYKRRERRSRTRKQEREEEGVQRKKSNNKIIIKNYLKKKTTKTKKQACWPSQFCWSFLSVDNSGSLAQLFSIPISPSTQAASVPALQQPLDPQVQAMGGPAGPSVVHILPGACGLRSLQAAHTLWCRGCGLRPAPAPQVCILPDA